LKEFVLIKIIFKFDHLLWHNDIDDQFKLIYYFT
jgi:hypothetical protein